jgi:hypothetical protein
VDARGRFVVAARYRGPSRSGNGGYVAGRLAAYTADGGESGAVEVTLRQPPPLEAGIDVVRSADGSARATFGGALIAEARPATLAVDPVDPVSSARAAAAGEDFAGLASHPFPECFTCGPWHRSGLRLRPGPIPERPGTTAAPEYAVAGRIDAAIVWAALDCPGGWTLDQAGRPAVLGRITAQIDALPEPAQPCVVMGAALGREGRKSRTVTTLYDDDGRVLARAAAVWLDVDVNHFR